jgi:UDP:flavonoid glycosyltransferase YjiC (YdhE family)
MSTFLVASIPALAHTTNPLPFARRLMERGHDVLWCASSAYQDQLAAAGVSVFPYQRAHDFGGVDLEDEFPWLRESSTIPTMRRVFAEIFVGDAPARLADLQDIIAERPVDAVLTDGLTFAPGLLDELGGPVWATFGDGPLPPSGSETPPFGPGLRPMRGPLGLVRNRIVGAVSRRMIFGPADRRYREIRADLGLPPATHHVMDAMISPYLHLQGCTPAFEYPQRRVPQQVHWVGALRPDPPAGWEPPAWWSRVTDAARPVVLVSQGSLRPDVTELLVPAIRGLAGLDVTVVVVTGQADPSDVYDALGGDLPGNVLTTRFVPYDTLLPHVSAFVTNGGYSGVTLALAHGVPLVQAGMTEEKHEIARRIEWTGVGVRLGTTRPSPESVAGGVRIVLDEPRYREAAGRVRAEMAQHDAGAEGADLLEELARTRVTVPRLDGASKEDLVAVSPRSRRR